MLGVAHAAGGRRQRPGRSCRRADRQRLHPVRLVGLSAALPHVVPREQVVTMNSVATAIGAAATFLGAELHAGAALAVRRRRHRRRRGHLHRRGPGGAGAGAVACGSRPTCLGPDDSARAVHGSVAYAVATGWVLRRAHGASPCRPWRPRWPGWPPIAWCSASTRCWCWSSCGTATSTNVAGLGTAVLFVAATGIGSFLANVADPDRGAPVGPLPHRQRRTAGWPRSIQLGGVGLHLPVMMACGFLLGAAGQVVKLCADSRHADRRRRRAARPRVHRAGLAVLGVVHRRDHGGAPPSSPPTGTPPGLVVAGAGGLPASGWPRTPRIGRRRSDRRTRVTPWPAARRRSWPTCAPRATNSTPSSPTCPTSGWRTADARAGLDRSPTRSRTCWWTDRVVAASRSPTRPASPRCWPRPRPNPTGFVDAGAEELAATPPAELLAEWRATRPRCTTNCSTVADGRKLPWFGPPMSADVDGHRPADGDLGARPRRRRRARRDAARRRPGCARSPTSASAPGTSRSRCTGCPAGRAVPRGAARARRRRRGRGDPPTPPQRVTGSAEDFCMLVTQRRPRAELDVDGRRRRRASSG